MIAPVSFAQNLNPGATRPDCSEAAIDQRRQNAQTDAQVVALTEYLTECRRTIPYNKDDAISNSEGRIDPRGRDFDQDGTIDNRGSLDDIVSRQVTGDSGETRYEVGGAYYNDVLQEYQAKEQRSQNDPDGMAMKNDNYQGLGGMDGNAFASRYSSIVTGATAIGIINSYKNCRTAWGGGGNIGYINQAKSASQTYLDESYNNFDTYRTNTKAITEQRRADQENLDPHDFQKHEIQRAEDLASQQFQYAANKTILSNNYAAAMYNAADATISMQNAQNGSDCDCSDFSCDSPLSIYCDRYGNVACDVSSNLPNMQDYKNFIPGSAKQLFSKTMNMFLSPAYAGGPNWEGGFATAEEWAESVSFLGPGAMLAVAPIGFIIGLFMDVFNLDDVLNPGMIPNASLPLIEGAGDLGDVTGQLDDISTQLVDTQLTEIEIVNDQFDVNTINAPDMSDGTVSISAGHNPALDGSVNIQVPNSVPAVTPSNGPVSSSAPGFNFGVRGGGRLSSNDIKTGSIGTGKLSGGKGINSGSLSDADRKKLKERVAESKRRKEEAKAKLEQSKKDLNAKRILAGKEPIDFDGGKEQFKTKLFNDTSASISSQLTKNNFGLSDDQLRYFAALEALRRRNALDKMMDKDTSGKDRDELLASVGVINLQGKGGRSLASTSDGEDEKRPETFRFEGDGTYDDGDLDLTLTDEERALLEKAKLNPDSVDAETLAALKRREAARLEAARLRNRGKNTFASANKDLFKIISKRYKKSAFPLLLKTRVELR